MKILKSIQKEIYIKIKTKSKKKSNKIQICLSKENIGNNKSESYKIKPRRIIDNYSYYYKI